MAEQDEFRANFMTPEEARQVTLSLNPLKRSTQVHALIAEHFGLRPAGWGFHIAGRRDLIHMAETIPGYYDEARELVRGLGELSVKSNEQEG